MIGRLFEALLATLAGVLAATAFGAVRLVLPGSPRPGLDDLGHIGLLVSLGFLPVLFCVAVPFAFRLGRALAERPLLYYAAFSGAGAVAWLANRWMFGGPHLSSWKEWLVLGVLVLAACPAAAWALRARLRASWASERTVATPMKGPSSMVLAGLCTAAVATGWYHAKWAALSIVDGDFALPKSMVFRSVDWVGFALAGALAVALVGLAVRGQQRRERGWTLARTGIALALAMALVPFTQYLAEFLLLPESVDQRALPDPQVRWSPQLAVRQLLHFLPAFALLFLFVHPPAALVRARR